MVRLILSGQVVAKKEINKSDEAKIVLQKKGGIKMKKIKLSVLGLAVIAVLSFELNGVSPNEHSSSEIQHTEIKSLSHGWGI